MNKFHARTVTMDGVTYPSKAERDRHAQLLLLQRAKDVQAVAHQPKYPLTVNGVTIGTYTADFAYFQAGRKIVEDVKGGPVRPADSLRMRLFMALYPDHELRIVDAKGGSRPMKQRAVKARAA